MAVLRVLSVLALALFAVVGCNDDAAKSEAQSPSKAMANLLESARAGDEEAFKKGLSKNFVLVIQRYQELGETKPELKGAFSFGVFMRNFAQSEPIPEEEMVKGDKATVRAKDKAGRTVKTSMVREDGAWKLEVPDGLVTQLDHFDEVAKLAEGEEVPVQPDLPTGGGGKADRMKNLPPDATDAQKAKAQALDAFDLGDLSGAPKALADALALNKDDEELTVALGRAYLQTGRSADAVKLLEGASKGGLAQSPGVHHYLGAAYMFDNRYMDAATEWRKVGEIDAAYSKKNSLDNRAQIAEQMATGGQAPDANASPHGH